MKKKKKRGYTKDRLRGIRKGGKRQKKYALGFSPAKKTASGAGSHGGSPRAQTKRQRKKVKEDLKNWQE